MLLLVVDTSGPYGSLALARGNSGGSAELIESIPLEGGTFSAQLVPQIASLLSRHGYRKSDIEGFIVVSGPGSFTGLRVGLAAIKALAEILKKPIVTVTLLEALIAGNKVDGHAIAALDAGRKEVFCGERDPTKEAGITESLLTQDELRSKSGTSTVLTPDASIVSALHQSTARVTPVKRPNSADFASLGWKKLQAGHIVSPEDLDAEYIRRSDAEIFSRPR